LRRGNSHNVNYGEHTSTAQDADKNFCALGNAPVSLRLNGKLVTVSRKESRSMTTKDPKPGAEPAPASDPLSATGIFLNAFRTQAEEPDKESVTRPAPVPPAMNESKAPAPGEFTQLFGTFKPVAPAPVQSPIQGSPLLSPQRPEAPAKGPEEPTRIFVREAAAPSQERPRAAAGPSAAAPAQRMKGYSSPGASDSASDNGSFSQFFPKMPSSPAVAPPANSTGATDLFNLRAAAEAPKVNWAPAAEAGSVTEWMRKLSEEGEPVSTTQVFEVETPAPVAPPVPSEYTRIISRDAPKAPKAVEPAPAVEPPKAAAPPVAVPQSKLQQMLPILLVLNGFLLVVLIILVVFVLLRK
jgi:hypothetical protein